MMGVDNVRSRNSREQSWRDRVRGVTLPPANRPQCAPHQAARLALLVRCSAEADQLTVDVRSQGSRQLEWVAFAATE
jgi:hypothetical protein